MLLKDYIQYYIGCNIKRTSKSGEYEDEIILDANEYYRVNQETYPYSINLILRKLEDITDEEKIELFNCYKILSDVSDSWKTKSITDWIKAGSDLWSFEQTHYLLKKRFDIFSLIENSLAIDSKTLK